MRGYTTALVQALLAMMQEGGFALPRLLRELELPPACAESPDVPLTAAAVRRIADAAERGLEDPFVGLHAAERVTRGTYGLTEFITRSSLDLREALEGFARYSRLLNDHFFVRLESRGEDLAVEQSYLALGGDPGRHQSEFTLAVVVAMGRQVLQRAWSPPQVWFSHPRPADVAELERFFGTKALGFDARANGFLATAEALAWPIPGADPALRRVLQVQADRELVETPVPDDVGEQVRRAIRAELEKGSPRLSSVAGRLHLSVRTLQRRLADAGLSFGDLADEVRSAAAKALIAQPQVPLAEVAFRLGYTSFGAFIRAFKGWTGRTPGEYRGASRG